MFSELAIPQQEVVQGQTTDKNLSPFTSLTPRFFAFFMIYSLFSFTASFFPMCTWSNQNARRRWSYSSFTFRSFKNVFLVVYRDCVGNNFVPAKLFVENDLLVLRIEIEYEKHTQNHCIH